MKKIHSLSGSDLARKIRSRDISSVEAVEHFIARIQIKYNDMVMAERHLGSCVAEDVAKWFETDVDGVVDDMIKEALPEAEQACRNLLNDLMEDFS